MIELNEDQIARFSAYVDGELSPEERQAFEAELSTDAELGAAFEVFRGTLDALAGLHPVVAPEGFATAVQRRIRRRSRGRYFQTRDDLRQRYQVELFVVVAAIVLGVVAVFSHMRTRLPDPGHGVPPSQVVPESGSPGEAGPGAPAPQRPVGAPEVPPDGSSGGTGSGDGAGMLPGALEDDALPAWMEAAGSGSAEVPLRTDIRRPTTVLRYASPRRVDFRYTVQSSMPAAELEAWVVRQYGVRRMERQDGAFVVRLRGPQAETGVLRAGELGPVTRERVALRPGDDEIEVRIRPAAE